MDFDLTPAKLVLDDRAAGVSVIDDQPRHADVIYDHRARLGRAERIGEREARVVGGGVEIRRAALEARRLERGFSFEHRVVRQPSMSCHVAKQGQRIIGEQAGAQLPA
jgi:hypothetical protein